MNMQITNQHTLEFADANFEAEVLRSNVPVLVDFWAEWCPPCRALSATIEELAADYAGRAKVGKVDVDSNREAAAKFGVQSIPNIVLFKNGEVAQRFVGLTSKKELAAALDGALS